MMIRCSACDGRLGVEMLIPSEVWEQIADGDYALCALCMDERMVEKGVACEGMPFFRGQALTTHITPEILRTVIAWRPSQAECVRQVGNPRLYT